MSRGMRHSASMRKANAADQVFRLTDMDVEEVSMVDRAANKKKFLVVKRDGDQMTTEVTPNGKGGFTQAGGGAKAAKAGGGAMAVPPGFKEAIAPILDKAKTAIEELDTQVSASTPADDNEDGTAPGVPPEFANAISNVMNLLDRAQSMWPTTAPEPDGEGADVGDGAPDEATTAMTMRLSLDNIDKVFRTKRLQKALVQKLGAKMSKDRLTRLQQAVATLSNLVNEVAGQPAPPTGAPPVGKTDAKKNAPNGQPDPLAALASQVGQLAQQVAGIAGIVAKDHKAIEAISKSRGAPSGGPVEGTTDVTKEEVDVSWPLDMNAPITRETVGKSESFFDD